MLFFTAVFALAACASAMSPMPPSMLAKIRQQDELKQLQMHEQMGKQYASMGTPARPQPAGSWSAPPTANSKPAWIPAQSSEQQDAQIRQQEEQRRMQLHEQMGKQYASMGTPARPQPAGSWSAPPTDNSRPAWIPAQSSEQQDAQIRQQEEQRRMQLHQQYAQQYGVVGKPARTEPAGSWSAPPTDNSRPAWIPEVGQVTGFWSAPPSTNGRPAWIEQPQRAAVVPRIAETPVSAAVEPRPVRRCGNE